ncbi:hypothetical protein BH10BAC5_BH10BAC5_16920 [soil metagenome]
MPFPFLAAGIGAGLGALANVLGNNKIKDFTYQDLMNSGYTPINESEEVNNINRAADGQIRRLRNDHNSKASEKGLSPVTGSYLQEDDILNNALRFVTDIRTKAKQEKNDITLKLFSMNAGRQNTSDLEAGLGGLVSGASLGLNFYQAGQAPTGSGGNNTNTTHRLVTSSGFNPSSLNTPEYHGYGQYPDNLSEIIARSTNAGEYNYEDGFNIDSFLNFRK